MRFEKYLKMSLHNVDDMISQSSSSPKSEYEKDLDLTISYLPYNKELGVFAPYPSQINNVRGSGNGDCKENVNKGSQIKFIGDPVQSRILVGVKKRSNDCYQETASILDTGSEVNVVLSQYLLERSWLFSKQQRDERTFLGPSGNHLKFVGTIKLWVKIGECEQLVPFVILDGNESSLIIGNPGMKKFGMTIKPGVGATIQVNSCKELQYQRATSEACNLEPLIMKVVPEMDCSIPRFCQRWITFLPKLEKHQEKIDLSQYEFQQFLFRDCYCIIEEGQECEDCDQRGEQPPFQLCRLENNQFQICFQNSKNFDWLISSDQCYAVEFEPLTISKRDIARDLLVALDYYDPQMSLSKRDLRDYEGQCGEIKDQLAEIVCEPDCIGVDGFCGPTLKIFPMQQQPEYSEKNITLSEYVQCNPCQSCNNANLKSCDPKIIGCISRKLYDTPLPEVPVSQLIYHEKLFPIDLKVNRSCMQIWGMRPGCENLKIALQTKHPVLKGSPSCEKFTVGPVCVRIVYLGITPITLKSTEALQKIHDFCKEAQQFELYFGNLEIFKISKLRLRKIFHDYRFRLHVYEENVFLGLVKDIEEGERKCTKPKGLGEQKTEQVIHGLPSSIINSDIRDAEKSYIEKGKVEELILCQSEQIKKDTIDLLDSHPRLWAKSAYDVGLFRDRDTGQPVRFELKLKHFEPIVQPPRFVSMAKQEAAKEVLGGLLRQNILKSQYSRNRLNCVYVPKKVQPITQSEWVDMGNKLCDWKPGMQHPERKLQVRMCVDFSPINAQLVNLPMLPNDSRNIITAIQGNRLLSVMDVSLAFNSLLLSRTSQDLCGFSPGIRGMPPLVLTRVAMGASTSMQLLQLAMNHALQGCLEYAFLLADDIVCLSDTEENMLERLSCIFQSLENCGFVLKREKLALYIGAKNPCIEIFGMIIDMKEKKCRPVGKKVDEILNRSLPTTITGIRSLNGMLAWQSGFLQGGDKHHAVLHSMTRLKDGKYDLTWTEERLEAIEFFLDKLNSVDCLLHLPSMTKTMFIATDASLKSCGFYLWQEADDGRPLVISYQARVFTDRQSKYCAFEREAISALWAILSFWSYIENRKTILITDSTTSFYINFFSKVNSKIARYRIFLQSLSDWLEIKWKKNDHENILVADYLSRRSQQPRRKVNQQVSVQDEELGMKIASKLKKEYVYSMHQSSHIIDYITEMSQEELDKLPSESYIWTQMD